MKAVFYILTAAYVSFCMTLYVASNAEALDPVAVAAPVAANESPEAAAPVSPKGAKRRGTSDRKQSIPPPSKATPVPVGSQPKSVFI